MNANVRNICALVVALCGGALGASPATKPSLRVADPMVREALITPRAQHAGLLGVASAGERLVAVGEHGVILYSDDRGVTWTQAHAPVSVTLTVVRFVDQSHGWAAGHNGVVLETTDAGVTWERVLDGKDVIALYQEQAQSLAQRYGKDNEQARGAGRKAQQFASDGPDKPWLDMSIDKAGDIWLVGAYGLALRSHDGKRWEVWSDHLDNANDLHLYAVKTQGNEVFIAGEQGLLMRSSDNGEHFERLTSPYKGSFFVLEVLDAQVLVAGLRGSAFSSVDRGAHFEPVTLPAPVNVTASLRLPGGDVLLADQAGTLYRLARDRLSKLQASAGANPSAVALAGGEGLVSVGSLGPTNISALSRP